MTAGSALLAVWLGWLVAEGSYTLPALAGVIALAAVLVRITRLPADVILLGLLLLGYIVGNRGFAQLMPVPWLPLFPAEWGLAAGLGWLVVQSALQQKLPLRRDILNRALLLWLALGTARVAIDVPRYGIMALRDYAMIYYASFFFLAQYYAAEVRRRNFLVACIGVAATVLLPVYLLFSEFLLFFLTTLTVQGVPLIYLKGDLAATFLAAGSVIIFYAVRGPHRYWGWPLSMVMLLSVLAGGSRAALVGGIVATVWLALTRRWSFPAVQAGAVATALAVTAVLAFSGNSHWAEAKLDGLRDRIVSMVDVNSTQNYDSDESFYKGDNNRFRLVWWWTLTQETWNQGRIFGLGFGYDLAKSFVQIYDPMMGEDFSARSPHSIIMSAFGRMGLVGLAAFLAIVGAITVRTWRALQNRSIDPLACGLWCAAWVILVSACFGVVLEGPMGAVVFWTVLGLANGMTAANADALAEVASPQPQVPSGDREKDATVEPPTGAAG
ncbi:MAG: O-antigen ligase family protein [Opitutaceae bacterium]|nr:O-antigen ligase family protein [Opitutaceae bacterium]